MEGLTDEPDRRLTLQAETEHTQREMRVCGYLQEPARSLAAGRNRVPGRVEVVAAEVVFSQVRKGLECQTQRLGQGAT